MDQKAVDASFRKGLQLTEEKAVMSGWSLIGEF